MWKKNHPKTIFFKQIHEPSKTKKKYSKEQQVSLCAYSLQPSKSSSKVEWIMDFGASNHMTGSTSLFKYYDTKKNTTQKVSIHHGKQLLDIRSSNVNVPNSTLEYLFHVQGIPINLLFYLTSM